MTPVFKLNYETFATKKVLHMTKYYKYKVVGALGMRFKKDLQEISRMEFEKCLRSKRAIEF